LKINKEIKIYFFLIFEELNSSPFSQQHHNSARVSVGLELLVRLGLLVAVLALVEVADARRAVTGLALLLVGALDRRAVRVGVVDLLAA